MGELFWNKIFGAVLGTALVIFSLNTFSDIVFASSTHGGGHGGGHGAHADDTHGDDGHGETKTAHNSPYPGFPIELPADGTGATVVVEEGPVDYGLLLAAADVGKGERVFAGNCASCHNVGSSAAHGQGPRMWDVVGQPGGGKDGFGYSAALGGWGQVWSYEALDGFIKRPGRYMSGTAMNFRGVSDEGTRMDIIAYLRTLSDTPYPLPDPLPAEPIADMAGGADHGDGGTHDTQTASAGGEGVDGTDGVDGVDLSATLDDIPESALDPLSPEELTPPASADQPSADQPSADQPVDGG